MRLNAAAVTLLLIMIATTSAYGGISVFSGSAPKDETEGGFRNGQGRKALFAFPNAICSDNDGNIYVADSGNNRVRLVRPDGTVSTYAGTGQRGHRDGKVLKATFVSPSGIAISTSSGSLFVADTDRVRKIDATGNVTTVAVVEADPQRKSSPHLTGIAIDKFGNIYVVDRMNRRLLLIDAKGAVAIVARTEREPHGVAVNDSGDIFLNEYERIFQVSRDGNLAVYVANSQRDEATHLSDLMNGMAFDKKGNLVVADEYCGVLRIKKGTKKIVAVPGLEANASGIAIGKDGEIYVSSGMNHLIYRINERKH